VDVLNHIQDAKEVYMHDACKRIIMPDCGIEAIFKKYFGSIFDQKISSINCPGCLPKYTEQSDLEVVKTGVACLASDYELKGVDLVLEAWECINKKSGWKLYLACPNIPQDIIKKMSKISFPHAFKSSCRIIYEEK
jgi:hypothetical protein